MLDATGTDACSQEIYLAHAEKAGLRLMRDKERPNVCRHFKIRKGDVDRAFQEADLILEDRYTTSRIQHCQLEPCTSVAWLEPDGTLRLRSSTQGVHIAKNVICKTFNLPPDKVIVECPYIGGSFGGRGSPTSDPYAVLLSLKTNGRPVRVSFTREEHFHCAHSRVGVVTYIKDGVKKDGTITARQLKVLLDTGAYSQGAMMLVRNCAFGAVGIYNIQNFKFDSYGVYTNTPMATAFRGFGSQEIIWAIENQMDVISERLGLHPLEMRRRNLLHEGDIDVCGQKVQSIGIERCLGRAEQWIEWDRKPPVENSSLRRGKGIALRRQTKKEKGHALFMH